MMAVMALALGLAALGAGVLAVVAAVVSTWREQNERAKWPLHQVEISIDGMALPALGVRSEADPATLAKRIAAVLSNSL